MSVKKVTFVQFLTHSEYIYDWRPKLYKMYPLREMDDVANRTEYGYDEETEEDIEEEIEYKAMCIYPHIKDCITEATWDLTYCSTDDMSEGADYILFSLDVEVSDGNEIVGFAKAAS